MPKTVVEILGYKFLNTEVNRKILEIVTEIENAVCIIEHHDCDYDYASILRTKNLICWLNICNEQFVTVGFLFASMKKFYECELLIRVGANLRMVAAGAAYAGAVEYAEELISRMGPVTKANLHTVAAGAALGGKILYVNELIQRMGGDLQADLNRIAACAALGGHIKYADELIQRMGGDLKADLNRIATCADLCGSTQYAGSLRAREQRARKQQVIVIAYKCQQILTSSMPQLMSNSGAQPVVQAVPYYDPEVQEMPNCRSTYS